MRTAPLARSLTRALILVALLFVGIIAVREQATRHPETLPWTPLSLADPVTMFTAGKLAALADDAPLCRRLLAEAGVGFTALPPRRDSSTCGYADGVIVSGENPTWRPAAAKLSCPVAAALHIWERDVVRPAALRHFGRPVTGIDHLGSFNCRRIAGSENMSEHATANAIDVAGFRLKGGTRVRVLGDWNGDPARAAFLREVRDGACTLFGTTLSPDYNAAHADHFHLDQARRGMGRGFCR